jgi:hypothetical protein
LGGIFGGIFGVIFGGNFWGLFGGPGRGVFITAQKFEAKHAKSKSITANFSVIKKTYN